jgi:PAS domain S-box-containing protein/diguanylate cyclase (GGDEF)-like protein
VTAFAARWARALEGTSYVTLSSREVVELLTHLGGRLSDALVTDPFDPAVGHEVAAELVRAHFTGSAAVERTVEVVAALPADLGREDRETQHRLHRLQGALASGYAESLRDLTLREQESLQRAALAARSAAELALRESEARFRAIFAGAAIAISVGDTDGRILTVNQALVDLLGYPDEEISGHRVDEFVHPDDGPAVVDEMYRQMMGDSRGRARVQARFLRRDGEVVWAQLVVSLVRDDDGEPVYVVAMGEDVSERHELQARLEHQAHHDPLTGLPNRLLLFERLADVYRGPDEQDRVGMCLVDLDGIGMVNDALDREMGDRVLVAAADRLSAVLERPADLLARLGGDEFAVLVPQPSGVEPVVEIAERVAAAFAEPLAVAGHLFSVGASVGVVERPVLCPQPAPNSGGPSTVPDGAMLPEAAADLLRAADISMQWAKAEREGGWAVYDADRHAREVTRSALAAMLPGALGRGEFVVDYQPLIRLSDGTLHGAEALVRWRHPRHGLLDPARFIGLAEETGAIMDLGRMVLEQACAEASRWQPDGGDGADGDGTGSDVRGPVLVSVNVSARQLVDARLVPHVFEVLAASGLPPQCLQLEITESAVVGSGPVPTEALRRLAAAGVRIAVDDFGTGYSNLTYLRTLPVHELKLAGAFVQGLRHGGSPDTVDERVVATLVSLAHTLGLRVTAEEVETPFQAERLRAVGCDFGQGWFFAAPGPAADVNPRTAARAPLLRQRRARR